VIDDSYYPQQVNQYLNTIVRDQISQTLGSLEVRIEEQLYWRYLFPPFLQIQRIRMVYSVQYLASKPNPVTRNLYNYDESEDGTNYLNSRNYKPWMKTI